MKLLVVEDDPKAARFLKKGLGEEGFVVDGWYLQQIVSAPLSEATAAEEITGTSWRSGLEAFAAARREQAQAAQ